MKRTNFFLDKIDAFRKKIRTATSRHRYTVTATEYADRTWEAMKNGMKSLGKEAQETEEMAVSFFRLLEHKLNLKERKDPPTEEEVKKAIRQLKDVGRFSFFATMVILPGGVVSLIGLEILAKKLGLKDFTLVPSSFRKKGKAENISGSLKIVEEDDLTRPGA